MKKIPVFLIVVLSSISINLKAQTNDFYDDAPTYNLNGNLKIIVGGEVENEAVVDLSSLPLRSVIVKETTLDEGRTLFTGAYRYDGYSLYDILDRVVLKKKNAAVFPPIIDLYVEVSNENGDKVVFSWGEIYYPNNRHQLIIASAVARIVPSKTKELWPLPADCKVVAGTDLITVRNISNPTRITVRSIEVDYPVTKGMSPMFCEKLRLCKNGKLITEISGLPAESKLYTYKTVFYGRGMGIHGTTPFTGAMLSDILKDHYVLSVDLLRQGLVVIAGADGYRGAFTISETINRNDQQEILLIDRDNYEGAGRFSLFPACDYFSDRAIKSIMEINIRE